MNQNQTESKPPSVEEPRYEGLDETACSASLRMIRLVVQLVDTPRNREVMDILQATAKATAVQGPHAAIKREDVQILALHTTRPPQNTQPSGGTSALAQSSDQ